MGSNRDDFPQKTKEIMAKQVAFRCSNPNCRQVTCGAGEAKDSVVNIGVAAHICAAAPGGKRYDANMTKEQRKDIDNGIWMCQNCAKLIDSDEKRYPVELLRRWKDQARKKAAEELQFRPGESAKRVESLEEFLKNPPECKKYEDYLGWTAFLNGELDRLVEKMEELQRKIDLARAVYDKNWSMIYERQFENTRALFGEINSYIIMLRERFETMHSQVIMNQTTVARTPDGMKSWIPTAPFLDLHDGSGAVRKMPELIKLQQIKLAQMLKGAWSMAEQVESAFAQCDAVRKEMEAHLTEEI